MSPAMAEVDFRLEERSSPWRDYVDAHARC
jgi:hypothetical protein